ncbi:MAG: hypothetical protein Q4C91_13130 [Eubacteriales bacterium]|nr:hypothetical protein [Eubacteriales bacterium]
MRKREAFIWVGGANLVAHPTVIDPRRHYPVPRSVNYRAWMETMIMGGNIL